MIWLPRTLFARLMWIWLLGLAVVLGTSYWLFLGEPCRPRGAAR